MNDDDIVRILNVSVQRNDNSKLNRRHSVVIWRTTGVNKFVSIQIYVVLNIYLFIIIRPASPAGNRQPYLQGSPTGSEL